MTTLYSLDKVTRVFGERTILDIPELVIESHTIYGLLGPNGAGKTTLMKLLAFMDTPTTGFISFEGQRVAGKSGAALRSRVVWVPQTPIMFTGTLAYNIEYPMKIKGINGRTRKERMGELLELVGLSHLAKAPAQKLSGGEAQRASIARALAAGAEVILFDEPTASVDFKARGEIIRLIRMLHEQRGLSLIVTTHDRSLAMDLCSRFITLFDGKLIPELSEEASLFRQGEVVFPANLWRSKESAIILLERSSVITRNGRATVRGMELGGAGMQVCLALEEGGTVHVNIQGEEQIALGKTLGLETDVFIEIVDDVAKDVSNGRQHQG